MYNCDFSRSDGAGSATTRNTRGLTRSVMALIVPPFPAASRPSNTTITRSPLAFTHSWSTHNFPWSRVSSFSNFLRLILWSSLWLLLLSMISPASLLPAAAERPIELGARAQFCSARLRQEQLLPEQILIRGQDFYVVRE